MTKVVPVQIDNGTILYIEAQEDIEATAMTPPSEVPCSPTDGSGEQRRGGAKGLPSLNLPPHSATNQIQSMQLVQSTIRTYALYCLNAFRNFGAANVNEVTLEFGVNLSADAGIPYIASGKAQSNLKITVKCSYDKPEVANGQG